VRIVERTLCIGFGIKRASEAHIVDPQATARDPALGRRERVPLHPLCFNEIFGFESPGLFAHEEESF
jgi:hypothetical protein